MEYANTLTALIHAYVISTCGLKIKAAMLGKNTEIEADSYIWDLSAGTGAQIT